MSFFQENMKMKVFDFDNYNLLISALVTIGIQGSFFVIAAACKFDKVTDFAGGSNFLVLALLSFLLNKTYQKRQIAITVLVVCWSLRLTGYLFYRILKIGEDKRFDDKRGNVLKFAAFWIFQALWVYTVSLPMLFINGVTLHPDEFVVSDYVGIALFAIGLFIEGVADQQKFNFRNDPDNKGKWCNKGLWSWSRHPNYFGEILVWWGAFIVCIEVAKFYVKFWTAVLSPLFAMSILLFLSGIPLLEQKADERYGRIEEYRIYKLSTSPLVLLPPCIYRNLHKILKALFCCEFPMYSSIDTDAEYDQMRP